MPSSTGPGTELPKLSLHDIGSRIFCIFRGYVTLEAGLIREDVSGLGRWLAGLVVLSLLASLIALVALIILTETLVVALTAVTGAPLIAGCVVGFTLMGVAAILIFLVRARAVTGAQTRSFAASKILQSRETPFRQSSPESQVMRRELMANLSAAKERLNAEFLLDEAAKAITRSTPLRDWLSHHPFALGIVTSALAWAQSLKDRPGATKMNTGRRYSKMESKYANRYSHE